ncbi:MAG: SIR2 family protein [Chloroflexi bacterium]|nr:SIR2 family protein [Chloroflexota bacterium]
MQATPSFTPALYRDFAERLRPNDVVLTFNYDTLLEQALDDIGKPYSLTPEWWLDVGQTRSERRSRRYVDLLKLHGSIDWYDRYYHDDIMAWYKDKGFYVPNRDPIFGPEPSVPSEPLSWGPTDEVGSRILPRVFRVPNHEQYFPIEGGLGAHVVPFILPPAYDKLLGNVPILDLWDSLHRTMVAFSSMVVIGYSIPPYDAYAYEALGRLFIDYQRGGDETYWGQRRVPIQLITLADSKQNALDSIPFLQPFKTRVWCQGFSTDSLKWVDWAGA